MSETTMLRLRGVDGDERSWDELTNYAAARRFMDYDLRAEATDEERAWLHAHPLDWMRALKAAKRETDLRIQRAMADLRSHPDKPTSHPRAGSATREQVERWRQLKAEADQRAIRQRTFILKVEERIAMVAELLPDGHLSPAYRRNLLPWLLDIEAQLAAGADPELVRGRLADLILHVARDVEL